MKKIKEKSDELIEKIINEYGCGKTEKPIFDEDVITWKWIGPDPRSFYEIIIITNNPNNEAPYWLKLREYSGVILTDLLTITDFQFMTFEEVKFILGRTRFGQYAEAKKISKANSI